MIETQQPLLDPEFEEYWDFINGNDEISSAILTPKKIDQHFEELGEALNTLIIYPDLFTDLMVPEGSKFTLFFYQRLILRSYARYRQTFVSATRAASKSFLAYLSRYLTCMMSPRHLTFIAASIKKQAASITKEKIDDLWNKFPLLRNEMVKLPSPSGRPLQPVTAGADYATYKFSNGSQFDVVNAQSARGLRRNSGLFEEVIEQDQTQVNEVLLPLLNVSRRMKDGSINENEPFNAQKLFITSAGYQGTYSFDKFIETLCLTVLDPDHYNVLSLTYRIPLMHGLLSAQQINDVISSPSFEQDSFDREYNSRWSGTIKGAAFNYQVMQSCRKVRRAELKAHDCGDNEFYVVSADMAKDGAAATQVIVYKVKMGETHFIYNMVNGFEISDNDYLKVANKLKKTIMAYNPRLFVYDANGIGAALRDWLNKTTYDTSGEMLPGYGIINPPATAEKDLIRYPANQTIIYEVKANTQASDINYLFFSRMKSGTIKMLIPFREALEEYKKIKKFVAATNSKQKSMLAPYQMADKMQEELLNLDVVEILDTGKPALKVSRRNGKIQKDTFSAASYGVWAVHNYIELPYYKKMSNAVKTKSKFLTALRGNTSTKTSKKDYSHF